MNSNCHRLLSLCPLFHFCWKWGVRHSRHSPFPNFPPWGQQIKSILVSLPRKGWLGKEGVWLAAAHGPLVIPDASKPIFTFRKAQVNVSYSIFLFTCFVSLHSHIITQFRGFSARRAHLHFDHFEKITFENFSHVSSSLLSFTWWKII